MRVAGVACALVAGLSASAHADDVTLTYGIDIGAAAMRESHAGTTTRFYAGFAFGASAGVKVSPTLDVSLRLLAVRGGDAEVEGDFHHVTTTFLGPRIEFRPATSLELGLGFGAGAFDDPRRVGYAADLRVGYAIRRAGHDEVTVAVESMLSFVPQSEARDARDVVNVAVLVGYRRR